eukprot:3732578-Prymnesium_polylepis.1
MIKSAGAAVHTVDSPVEPARKQTFPKHRPTGSSVLALISRGMDGSDVQEPSEEASPVPPQPSANRPEVENKCDGSTLIVLRVKPGPDSHIALGIEESDDDGGDGAAAPGAASPRDR